MSSKSLIIGAIVIVAIIAGIFAFTGSDDTTNANAQNTNANNLPSTNQEANQEESQGDSNSPEENTNPSEEETSQETTWLNFPLEDVNSGETFTITELNDKPILMESFAVWCPKCTAQQENVKDLHKEIGEDAISISLNTDPNEDEEKVRQHAQSRGFDWRYAVAPSELTQLLIDEFGVNIINAPSVPMILICPDGSYRQLDSGIKSVNELKEEIATCS